MELTHTFTVPASVDETWAALNDIESVAGCFPGAQVTSAEGDTFEGSVKVKLGPIALVYNGTGTFIEKDEASHTMKIKANGKDKRGNGTAGANVVATMTDTGGETSVEVKTDLAVTGKPAQFGRGVMQDVSDKLLGQFVECLKTKVGGGAAPTAQAAAAPPAAAADAWATGGSSAPATSNDALTEAPVAKPAEQPLAWPGGTSTAASEPAAASPATAPAVTPAPASPAASSGSSTEHRAPAPQPQAASQPKQDDALDLGKTVLPILAKLYWKQAVAVVAVIVVVVVLLVVLL